MTIAFSNLPKIGVGVPKINTNAIPTPAHLRDFQINPETQMEHEKPRSELKNPELGSHLKLFAKTAKLGKVS